MSRIDWWIIQGSNLERTGYEPAALPIELMIHVEAVPGIEPGTKGYKALVLPLNYTAVKRSPVS